MAHDKTGIRWWRVIVAGLLTEISVILTIVIVVAIYSHLIAPGRTETQYQAFGNRAGSLIGPMGGALLAFLFALWACRALKRDFLINGLLVGLVGAFLHIVIFVLFKVEFQMLFVIADLLKAIAGALGGYVAQMRYRAAS